MLSRVVILATVVAFLSTLLPDVVAFAPRSAVATKPTFVDGITLLAKKKVDLSDIETRDMTREEMLELNAKNEEIMNMELSMMTGFSLVISLPILYLCWVAFFSD